MKMNWETLKRKLVINNIEVGENLELNKALKCQRN
jgi:hypothetical protein